MRRILYFICLIWLGIYNAKAEDEQKRGFIATFPTSVIAGGEAQFCIRFFNINNDVVVRIEDNEPNCITRIVDTLSSNKETCIPIQIRKDPHCQDENSLYKTIKVSGETVDGSYSFNETKSFRCKPSSSITFIETDKPVYKPGQLVRIRVLSLDYELNPLKKSFREIFILDSSNTRVHQWLNVINDGGLISLDLPLSDEPNFGIWTITVNDNPKKPPVATAKFEVKKYVLPKFEVIITPPSHVVIDEESFSVTVCAKYSYGKDVKGTLNVTAIVEKPRYFYFYDKSKETEIRPVSFVIKAKGCQRVPFNLKSLGIPSEMYLNRINVYADFTEDDTNLQASSSSGVDIEYRRYSINLVEPSFYKPGLPTKVKIRVTKPDKTPVSDKNVQIEITRSSDKLHSGSYVTDKDGFISFYLYATGCETNCSKMESLYIRTTIDEKDDSSLPYHMRVHSGSTGFSIKAWHSYENTYLQIYKPQLSDQIECLDKMRFNIKLKSPKPSDGFMYFQIQSRSKVAYAGSLNLNTNETILSVGGNVDDLKLFRSSKRVPLRKRQADTAIEDNPESDRCALNFDEGTGDANEESWYYDVEKKTCAQFTYKGGDGNANRFTNKDDCEKACGEPSKDKVDEVVDVVIPPKIIFESFDDIVDEPSIESFTLTVPVFEDVSPEFKLLVFYIINGEVTPDSVSVKVAKCLKNRVQLRLNSEKVKTGQDVDVSIIAAPKSLCALSAIDKSVTFMGKRNSVDFDKVFASLEKFNLERDYYNFYKNSENCSYDFYPFPIPRPIPQARQIAKRGYIPFSPTHTYDAIEAFKDSNLLTLSDLQIFKSCPQFVAYASFVDSGINGIPGPVPMMSNQIATSDVASESRKETQVEVVRQFFPETWLWQLEVIEDSGRNTIATKAPDSITDWIFNAYCLSNTNGFGVSNPVTLNVFQPFFVSVNLPYSVVKGEILPIQASVFNYLDKCVPVNIQLFSEKFLAIQNRTLATIRKCVCPDDKASHTFNVRAIDFEVEKGVRITVKVTATQDTDVCPASVGELANLSYSDSETRKILIEPEGIQKEFTETHFIQLDANKPTYTATTEIILPKNVVPKTARAFVSIIGDTMGPALSNLNNLVQLPTGCGEQNMVKFAPLVFVTKYLKDTSQLDEKTSNQAKDYMLQGYQRQLTYRHDDGSYSAFGKSDKEGGGTWLTAFVLRCLAASHELKHIEIAEKDLSVSFNWLLSIQDIDGSFPQVGTKLLSKGLAGGLGENKKIGLSAYVMVSLLSTIQAAGSMSYNTTSIDRGLGFLRQGVYNNISNVDTNSLVLILYAFKLSNENRNLILEIENELNKRATRELGSVYWKREGQATESFYHTSESGSADIETTSYVLLSKMVRLNPQDLSSLPPIAKWINSQRNSLGGFYSTQDTVVALDALSRFASAFYSKRVNMRFGFGLNSNTQKPVLVNTANRLLLQKFKLDGFNQDAKNVLNFDVNGAGTGLVQVSVKYNVKKETKATNDFTLSIQSLESKIGPCQYAKLEIKTGYQNGADESSMAIVSLRLPTGWKAVEDSVTGLLVDPNVQLKRYEINENRVVFYFNSIDKNGKVFSFDVLKNFDIKNGQPGIVSVYDYYEPQENAVNTEFRIVERC